MISSSGESDGAWMDISVAKTEVKLQSEMGGECAHTSFSKGKLT